MPSVEKLRTRLVEKLKELFQLDQPDLDFGFWRIMHARSKQVTAFLENDLLKIVDETFREGGEGRIAELQESYENALGQAKEFGAPDPENAPAVQKARGALEAARDTTKAEADIYDHLYRFFERYYDNGDFISRRYYTRETAGKAAPYAVPYDGSEVYLHWANADQYYIKTTEHFSNLTFDLTQAREVLEQEGELFAGRDAPEPRRVHFIVVEATEGEHGNVKASEQTTRYFIIHKDDPIGFDENGDMICRFEYRPDPEKTGQEGTWRDKRNAETVETIIRALAEMAKKNERAEEYVRLLSVAAPTEKHKDRPLLAKYVNQYTARNTMDYFIHKDLGGFLRRELDFYIKNEVMRLDDIENADAPCVEQYIDRIRVLRRIAHKLIDFLAQLENFQKKLWLKKKFVLETNYCITLDRIPEEFYPEIAANDAQRKEWVRLFAIDEIKGDIHTPAYSKPLTVEFLKANSFLVLDTACFRKEFKDKLLASVDGVDSHTDGLLLHSENFQALNLLYTAYKNQISCIYIDPPYNTGADGFPYKDCFQHSSWLSCLADRLQLSRKLLMKSSPIFMSIDDNELHNAIYVFEATLGSNFLATMARRTKSGGGSASNYFAVEHDYVIAWARSKPDMLPLFVPHDLDYLKRYSEEDEYGKFFWDTMERSSTQTTPYKIKAPDGTLLEGRWFRSADRFEDDLKKGEVRFLKKDNGNWSVQFKQRIGSGRKIRSLLYENEYKSSQSELDVLGLYGFQHPKPLRLMMELLRAIKNQPLILDYFAGSGTTGHAVINLNRTEGENRKYILVEIGDYFDTVLKPRILKVIYSKDWKDGKPVSREGSSHFMKYIRLESFEDGLSNLALPEELPENDPRRQQHGNREKALAQNPELREDYILRYMLDVETRGSQSLLNIDAFADPTAYKLKVKKPGSNEYVWKNVDLLETFNYLIGLRVERIAEPQTFSAEFQREPDPYLPKDITTRLGLKGRMRQDANGPWWFRRVEGWAPSDPNNPSNGGRIRALVIWRKLTGDIEKDNLMLDEYMKSLGISEQGFVFDMIYVNGSNNLPNLRRAEDNWKVRLIEEDFHRLMWDVSDV